MPGKHYDLDTDITLSNNDDKLIPSQKAVKTYVDTEVDKKADPTIIRDSESEVSVKELVINKLTNEEYDVAVKEDDQLYLTPDTTDQDIADAISEHNTSNSAHSTLFNAKQDKLTTQTAYTSKGTATKVPQITTNTLGQVTNITEVDITHQSIKTLKTDNASTQSTSSSETIAGSGTINLHKISKTGSYNDLLNKPNINDATLDVQVEGVSKGTFSANASTDSTINITKNDFVKTKTYTGLIGTANNQANATFYFMTVRGTTWNSEWSVRYRVDASLDEGLTPTNYQYYHGTFECYISGRQGIYTAYANFNSHSSTSYRTIYYQINHKTTEAGYNAGYGTKLGVDLTNANSNLDANYKRTIKITLLDCNNCTVTFNENPELPPNTSRTDYDKLNSTYYTTSDSNSAGNWTRLNSQDTGLQESGDANSTYGYLVNTINTGATKIDANGYGARYSLVFATTPLNVIDERWSSLVNSSGNGTSKTALTGLTFYIDRHPQYVYSANIAAGAASANALYQDFNATDARYICNTNNTYVTTNQKCFLYLKDFNPSDMSFKSDATIGNVFTLNKLETRFPSSTEDDIYIYFLGWTTGTWYNIVPAFTQVHKIFKYTPSTGAMVEFARDNLSKKQDLLDTQTVYTSQGSATKVPQITTNSLGQVTEITEVTITQPTVNNNTITIQKNSTNVDSFTLNQSTDKTINISVPTTVAELSDASDYVQTSSLEEAATVAKTGSYNDLIDKPTIPQGTVTAVVAGSTADKINVTNNGSTSTITINNVANATKASMIYNSDTRSTNENPQWYSTNKSRSIISEFKSLSSIGISGNGTYGELTTYTPWTDSSGGYPSQICKCSTTNKIFKRIGTSNTTWSDWKEIAFTDAIPTKTSDLTNDSGFLTTEADTLATVLDRGNSASTDINMNSKDWFNAGVKLTSYYYSTSQTPNTQYYWYKLEPPTSGSKADRYFISIDSDVNYPQNRATFLLDISKYSSSSYNVSLNCLAMTGGKNTHVLNVAIDADGYVYVQSDAVWSSYMRFVRYGTESSTISYTQVGLAAFGTAAGFTPVKMITDTGCIRLLNGAESGNYYTVLPSHYFRGDLVGNADTATKATKDGDNNTISSTYLKLSGGTLTGAVNTANNTLNKIGDDAYIGDVNIGGCIGIKGQNGASGIVFKPYSGSTDIKMTSNGSGTLTVTGTISSTFNGDLTGTASKATADADGNTISTTYLKIANLPTKLSDFTDDLGSSPTHTHSQYLTSHQTIKILKTTNTAAQSTSASEVLTGSGTINLHKIAKTGTFSDLLSKPTSISGYGITDAYTKTEVDGMISSVYKPAGSVAFASLPTLASGVLGNVYNVTDAFTTTADFVEGAGNSYPAGTNVVVIEPTSGTYKFDVLAGFVDLSGYVPTSRKVNGKALSVDITLSASDVGAQASGNYISYTDNTATVAGTSKTVSKTNPETLYVPDGLIMGGTAKEAGLVTRGICGVSSPTETGAATKDNLFINYDGNNTYQSGRQLVLQAGTVGTHYGNNLYQYAAARGDAVKNYADATYVPQTRTINSKTLNSNITLSASDVGAVSTTDGVTSVVAGTTANKINITKNGSTSTITVDNVATATKATQDASGNVITETYATKTEMEDIYACTFVDWSE